MRFKLVLYSAILVITISFITLAQTWRQALEPTYPGGTTFYAGTMVSKNVGYIVGTNGIILKSTNGGVNWNTLGSGVTRTLYCVYFLDEQNGFVGGSSRTLLKTTNGGLSWDSTNVSVIPDATAIIYGLYFADASNGWLMASTSSKGYILRTTNGGSTWIIDTTISKQLYAMHFSAPGKGIVVGKDAGTIWYTTNGTTWTNAPAPDLSQFPYTRSDIRSVFMVNRNLAIAVGWGSFAAGLQPSIILKSTDGGATWRQIILPEVNRTYDNLYSVWFKDTLNGFAVGGAVKGSILLKTTDGGETWIPLNTPSGSTLYFVTGIGDTLIAGGSDGLLLYSPDFGNSGTILTKIPAGTIYSMKIISRNIFAAGYDGVFLKSTNMGFSWDGNFVHVGKAAPNVNSIHFLNKNIGYAACSYRLVAKTTDGGETWSALMNDVYATTNHCYGVYFIDENKGFVVGQTATNTDVIYRTTNGGASWDTIAKNIGQNAWRAIKFVNNQDGIIVGSKLKALYTNDGGNTWNFATFNNVPSSLASAELRDVAFINDSVAIAVGNKIIVRTTDKGKTWSYVDSTTTLLYAVSFHNSGVGYAVGSGLVLKSTDGGLTWSNVYDPNIIKTASIYSVAVDSAGYPWIGCAYSYIYTTAPITSVGGNKQLPFDYYLAQNYPNPFNPSTTIEFTVPERSIVTIKIYNLLGQEVAVLVNEQTYEPGTHKINFSPNNLPSGIYFYQIKANDFIQTRKMVYIK